MLGFDDFLKDLLFPMFWAGLFIFIVIGILFFTLIKILCPKKSSNVKSNLKRDIFSIPPYGNDMPPMHEIRVLDQNIIAENQQLINNFMQHLDMIISISHTTFAIRESFGSISIYVVNSMGNCKGTSIQDILELRTHYYDPEERGVQGLPYFNEVNNTYGNGQFVKVQDEFDSVTFEKSFGKIIGDPLVFVEQLGRIITNTYPYIVFGDLYRGPEDGRNGSIYIQCGSSVFKKRETIENS